jgi:retinol dehydrogenase 14
VLITGGRLPRIDVLVNNAGGCWNTRHVTVDGLERTFAVNHLAPFLLTSLLLDRLKRSAWRRGQKIIN